MWLSHKAKPGSPSSPCSSAQREDEYGGTELRTRSLEQVESTGRPGDICQRCLLWCLLTGPRAGETGDGGCEFGSGPSFTPLGRPCPCREPPGLCTAPCLFLELFGPQVPASPTHLPAPWLA